MYKTTQTLSSNMHQYFVYNVKTQTEGEVC